MASPDQPSIAWHYGDPLGEQRATTRGSVLFDGWAGDMLIVRGEDRLTWLHTLTSQHFDQLRDGDAAEALWLSTHGHVEHWADAWCLDEAVYLRMEPGTAGALAEFLRSMVFWSKVEISDASAEFASLVVAGVGASRTVATALGITAPAAGHCGSMTMSSATGPAAVDGPAVLRGYPDRVAVLVRRADFPAVASALVGAGATPAGSWAADALRIAARRPRFGIDHDGRTLPNETPWLTSAVHLSKGCYRGQETVARIDNVGAPPRRLVLLHLDGSAGSLPATGCQVTTADGKKVGRVGTVAQHWEDGPIALALVKRTVGPGVALLADGVDCVIDSDDQPIEKRQAAAAWKDLPDFRRRR